MQLSRFQNITEDNIVFQTAKKHKVPNSKIKYQRIKIERKLPNGKLTPLVVETPFLFSLFNSSMSLEKGCRTKSKRNKLFEYHK